MITEISTTSLKKLESKDPKVKYGFAKELLKAGLDTPELLYDHFDYWIKLMRSENNILKWTAIDILGYISSVDKDNKTEKELRNLFDLLHSGSLITCNHAIFTLNLIAKNKPRQRTRIIKELISITKDSFDTKECKAIATGKVIESLMNFKSEIQDNKEILEFIKKAQNSQRNATKKKAGALMNQLRK